MITFGQIIVLAIILSVIVLICQIFLDYFRQEKSYITDEQIKKEASDRYCGALSSMSESVIGANAFEEGAKWARDVKN